MEQLKEGEAEPEDGGKNERVRNNEMALKEGEAAKEWVGREGYPSSRRVDVYYGCS